jgi:type IV fimbrial biogenesis protein FimT
MLSLRKYRGFTLIELLIAFGLVGILTLIAVPAFQHWIQNTQIRNGTEGIMNGMQIARAEAIRRNTIVQFVMSTGSGWTIATAAAPTAIIQSRVAEEGSSNAAITVTPAGSDRVSFNGMGWIAANADASPAITSIDVTSATMSGTEVRPLRVIVSTGGSPRMCDPAVGVGDTRACP